MLILKPHNILPLILCLFILTGCFIGRELKMDETTTVHKSGDDICFSIPNAKGYELRTWSSQPRNSSFDDIFVIYNPSLPIIDGQLCVPPSVYQFSEEGQFIVRFFLSDKKRFFRDEEGRNFAVGVEMNGKNVSNFNLTDMETLRR